MTNHKEPIHAVSITPNRISYFMERASSHRTTESREASLANLVNNAHNGDLSRKGSKRISSVVNWIAYLVDKKVQSPIHVNRAANLRIGLLTLTLPSKQLDSDQVIKSKCLNQLLIELRKDYGLGYYAWKAEKQKNGNLHFHVIIDRYINHKDLRTKWNRIINKLGYVNRYEKHFSGLSYSEYIRHRQKERKGSRVDFDKAWNNGQKYGWRSPNTIDIHSVREVKNMAGYLGKYMAKGDQDSSIEGRIWGSSQLLSKLKTCVAHEDHSLSAYLYKCYKQFDLRVWIHDHGHIVFLTSEFWNSLVSKPLELILENYIRLKFNPV